MKTNTNQNAFGQREYECKSTKMAALKKQSDCAIISYESTIPITCKASYGKGTDLFW